MQKTIPERLVILFFEFDHSNRPKSGLKNGSDNYQKIKILLLHRSSGLRVWKLSQMEKSNSTMTVITFTNIFGDHWPPNAVSGSDNFKILLFRLYWKNRYFPIHKWTKNARFRKRNIISATYRNYSFIGVFCTFLSRKCRPNRFLVFLKKNWKNPIHNLSTQSTQIEKRKNTNRSQHHDLPITINRMKFQTTFCDFSFFSLGSKFGGTEIFRSINERKKWLGAKKKSERGIS